MQRGTLRVELHALFKGRVQGVGFRWTVQACGEGLHGTVQNLPDGSVEVLAQGTREELERFLEAILADPGAAVIQSIKKTFRDVKGPLPPFTIKFS